MTDASLPKWVTAFYGRPETEVSVDDLVEFNLEVWSLRETDRLETLNEVMRSADVSALPYTVGVSLLGTTWTVRESLPEWKRFA